MTHIEEITEGLMEVFRDLRSGDMEAKAAVEINNTAGKVISAYKTRIAYHAIRGDIPEIEGLSTSVPNPALAARRAEVQRGPLDMVEYLTGKGVKISRLADNRFAVDGETVQFGAVLKLVNDNRKASELDPLPAGKVR